MNRKAKASLRQLRLAPWAIGGLGIIGVALGSFSIDPAATFQNRKTTDAPIAPHGKLGQDLFLAIDHRDLVAVKSLLQKGADPNSKNGLEFVPLYIAAASHQTDVMEALIGAGADPSHASPYGTPMTFACATANVDGMKLLLSHGVKADYVRTDGITPLIMATNTGAPPAVEELLKQKVDVNVQDDGGDSPLTWAARQGHVPVTGMLLAAGAKVNVADLDGMTPLMNAAMNGHSDVVNILLKHGAKPNAKDEKGRTALLLTANYGDYPEVVRALISAGANPKAKDSKGRTAASLAAARGFKGTLAVLGGKGPAPSHTRQPREAVKLSLGLLQTAMKQFAEGTTCVSCHQEGLGRIATGEAKARGFQLDPQVQNAQRARINGMLSAMRPLHEKALTDQQALKQVPLMEMNEITTVDTWILAGMAAQKQAPNDATAAMTMVLARQQQPDGCWTYSLPRAPMQSSFFTFTALSVHALEAYGPKSHGDEIRERIGKARDWFTKAEPKNGEDRASRLLGLKWTQADAKSRQDAAAAILGEQRPDGGWSQMPNDQSDAYATGQALYALHVGAGLPASAAAYKKGVAFLLRTQDDDGSWFVNKRAIPANNYFDAGFPHGESQYASFNGTSWATLALLNSLEPAKKRVALR